MQRATATDCSKDSTGGIGDRDRDQESGRGTNEIFTGRGGGAGTSDSDRIASAIDENKQEGGREGLVGTRKRIDEQGGEDAGCATSNPRNIAKTERKKTGAESVIRISG